MKQHIKSYCKNCVKFNLLKKKNIIKNYQIPTSLLSNNKYFHSNLFIKNNNQQSPNKQIKSNINNNEINYPNNEYNNNTFKSPTDKKQLLKYLILGSIFYLLYELTEEIFWPLIMRKFSLYLKVDQDDEAFHWLMSYFAQHSYTQNCTHLNVLSQDDRSIVNMLSNIFGVFGSIFNDKSMNGDEEGDEGNTLLFTPAQGQKHFLKYKGKLMWLSIKKDEMKESEKESRKRQSLEITILSSDRNILMELVEEARKLYKTQKHDKTLIYVPTSDCFGWEELSRKPKRLPNSVILQGQLLDDILVDIKDFVNHSEFYYTRGIPYRRGILLYGPPGSGKSSTVQVVAGELGMDVYVLNVSSNELNDEKLTRLLHKAPPRSIVLIEDVDSCQSAITTEFREERKENDQHVSVSGLLNSIDGINAQEGRILFLTTNHIDKLNDALIRPGRVDKRFYIGHANREQIKKLFISFYRHVEQVDTFAEQFVSKLCDQQTSCPYVTPAQLQGYFMQYKDTPNQAIEHISHLTNSSENK
ncbi:hypothetical protein ABK040_007200 [Willaertia magna]